MFKYFLGAVLIGSVVLSSPAIALLDDTGTSSEKPKTTSQKWARKNKETFPLDRANFSQSAEIDFDGLSTEIRHKFKNNELLREALYPLLPKGLKCTKKRYNHLEFLGDGVLGLIIKERVLALFPEQKRGIVQKIYSSLTENKALAEVYQQNLRIEKYLPFPGKSSCTYCDLVEAIIGAIYLDDSECGLRNAKKFIMHVLGDHVLDEKILEIAQTVGITLTPAMLPKQDAVLKEVCTAERLKSDSPKSLLQEVIAKLWTDHPTYTFSMKKKKNGLPIFSTRVSGTQIGRKIEGQGYSRVEAEEDAARKALNYLAKQKLLSRKKSSDSEKKYISLLKEFIEFSKSVDCKYVDIPQSPAEFKFKVKMGGEILAEGTGPTKKEAQENAAKNAYLYLKEKGFLEKKEDETGKNYRTLLKEYFDLQPSSHYEFSEVILPQEFKVQVKLGGNVVGEGTGLTKNKAKEEAALQACLQFIEKERRDS